MNVAVYGATGLTGSHLVNLLVTNTNIKTVWAASRTKPANLPSKVTHLPFSTTNMAVPDNLDILFCTLGTTLKNAGSLEAFEQVDLHGIVNLAKLAVEKGVKNFILVSSVGASAKSGNFYLQVKGKTEEELLQMPFQNIYIARPSLLIGKRTEKRFGEQVAQKIAPWLNFMLKGSLVNYKPIEALQLAKALIYIALTKPDGKIVETPALLQAADNYRL